MTIADDQDSDLPGIPIEIGRRRFVNFNLPSGEFRVFYAVLNQSAALDLLRVHCMLDNPKLKYEDYNYVQITVANGRATVSFSLPEKTSNGSLLYEGARTIQPLEVEDFAENVQVITVTISSRAQTAISGKIRVANYDRSQYNVMLPPTSPKEKSLANQKAGFVRPVSFRLATKGIDMLRIAIQSDDDICARLVVSTVQNIQVEGWDDNQLKSMEFSRRLDLLLKNELQPVIYMHIEVYPDDTKCSENPIYRTPNKLKVFNITWLGESTTSLLMPIAASVPCFLLAVALALIYAIFSRKRSERIDDGGALEQVGPENDGALYDNPETGISDSPDGDEGTVNLRREQSLHVKTASGVAVQKEWSWSSAQFAVILLPILSLVISAPRLGLEWNDDQCFHNYACAEPLWIFTSFNHIFSNAGYVFDSLFYLIFVKLRKKKPTARYGTYNNYGLEISMGLSLLCEALASSIYHTCPNAITYNLDTPFIEVNCLLMMLKLYGNRRQVITPQLANNAVTSVILFDSIITVIGDKAVLRGLVVTALIGVVLLGVGTLLLGPEYSLSSFRAYQGRHLSGGLAIGALLVNAIITLGFLFLSQHLQTTQFTTVLCIINTLLYLIYYVTMKLKSTEKWCKFSKRCIIAAFLVWSIALFFFLKEETDWRLTPAQSRALNLPCVLLGFFDYHDLWHLSSALASLLLLMGISSIDDDLCAIPTSEISVF
ncbi:unnamed protein product [Cylicocyclus nassatus]|uniref:SID1 transmembrane family member 2 n=1 Tax=Cylicocyclus nassatus TaxID=53992 RepID=A0AA36DKP4_CYLNA|nr:unnamed protein product [Cylicocyclus nassatus]